MHPALRGWYVFAAAGQTVSVHRVDDPARALVSIDAAIARSARVTLLPYGRAWHLDLHALPWRGQPLVQSRPVAYGLDLPPLAAPASPLTPLTPRILLVDDPTGDLPAARDEADALADALAGGTLDRLSGDRATGAAVRAGLPRASLFHYAGHGRFAGWESHLPLAGDSRLRIGDILTLARVPAHVILSGCETARTSAGAAPESLGIAQAFLAAGASQVVAAVRPVDDALAAGLGPLLHAGPTGAGPDLVLALQRAQIELARTGTADWPAFRVLIR
jgi:hypothetical protein